ncbi:hypothetical protein ZEAMMB73_Zm00001d012894 [Zea mays]|uniref:Uncharacterized protein n=1 Tax=Zea mays TaxID=4577 RepID=A0A1D6GDQ9_MAIZE|nr:hypothetical protein ZEAMMB73_Zm00001d012894 [Zea mays]
MADRLDVLLYLGPFVDSLNISPHDSVQTLVKFLGCVSTKIQNSLDQKLQLPIVGAEELTELCTKVADLGTVHLLKGLVLRTLDKVSCCYKGL